jgi:hypothetical protein
LSPTDAQLADGYRDHGGAASRCHRRKKWRRSPLT